MLDGELLTMQLKFFISRGRGCAFVKEAEAVSIEYYIILSKYSIIIFSGLSRESLVQPFEERRRKVLTNRGTNPILHAISQHWLYSAGLYDCAQEENPFLNSSNKPPLRNHQLSGMRLHSLSSRQSNDSNSLVYLLWVRCIYQTFQMSSDFEPISLIFSSLLVQPL